MKILHFSWEYPPVMFGGLGAHVVELTREQVKQGHQVTVITQQSDPASPVSEVVQGVHVLRANNAYPHIPFSQESLDMWAHSFALGSFATARDSMGTGSLNLFTDTIGWGPNRRNSWRATSIFHR